MVYNRWDDAVAALAPLLRHVTDQQRALGEAVGISFPKRLPWLVAGARLQVALSSELAVEGGQLPTDSQVYVIGELSDELERPAPTPASRMEAEAWIRLLYLTKRVAGLKHLRPVTGDIVHRLFDPEDEVHEIASIGLDGRLYFRGGRHRAWPDRVVKVASASDMSNKAEDLRRTARNLAAAQDSGREWSVAKMAALKPYEVEADLDWHDLEQLEEVVESAPTEEPIQRFLQERPHILGSLVRGPIRYSIPKAPIGLAYVTDFLLADVDSIGIRWVLVELETRVSEIALKSKNDFDKYARQGVSQVREWREWLQLNLANARQPRSEGGLGLFDIRPQADGLVLVGRRERLSPRAKQIRARLYEAENIGVHTYDWLVAQLRGVLSHHGPPAGNPFLLHRVAEPDQPF